MKIVATRKQEQNRAVLDPWTTVHFASGLALGLVNVPVHWAAAASVLYELSEQGFERKEWGRRFFVTSGPETLSNAFADTGVFLLGHWLGRAWNRTGDVPGRADR